MGRRSSLHEDFIIVKTHMGLGRFEVRFFSVEKLTKFDLALKEVIKNRSKVVYTLSVMCLRIWLTNLYFVKFLMGTPLDWKFFTLKKKISLPFTPRPNKSSKKSCSKLDIRYLRRMCFSSWSFLTQITNPMGLEGFIWLESLFVGQKKVASNRLRFQQQVAWM